MDSDLREKVDALAENFTHSEVFRHTPSNYNPYTVLTQALEQHARPKDTQILISVIDKIIGYKHTNEIYQGATEGHAITILTQFIHQRIIKESTDKHEKSPQTAVNILSNIILRKAEDIVKKD